MAYLWSLQGLSWRKLAKRTCRKSCDNEVFGQAAWLAFYYLFSMFPVLSLPGIAALNGNRYLDAEIETTYATSAFS